MAIQDAVAPPHGTPKRVGKRTEAAFRRRLAGILGIVLVGALTASPVILLLVSTFNETSPGETPLYGTGNWTAAFNDPALWSAIRNTLELAVVRIALTLVIALPIAWLLARTNLWGRKALEGLAWLSIFLPALPLTLGWIVLLNPTNGLANEAMRAIGLGGGGSGPLNIYGFWGITWVHLSATSVPYMVILTLPAFARMDASFEDAARISGASRLRAITGITAPLLKPAIFAATLMGFIYSLQAFEVELLLGSPVGLNVFSTQIYDYISRGNPQYGKATVLGSLFIAILLLMAVAYRRAVTSRDFTTVTGKSFSDIRIEMPRLTRILISGAVWTWFLVATIVPVFFMVFGSVMTKFGFLDIPHPFTLEHWRTALGSSVFSSSLLHSLQIGLASAGLGVVVYFVVAWLIVRSQLWSRPVIDVLAWIPLAVPGLLMGLGFLWIYLGVAALTPVLYGTIFGLALAIVIDHVPVGSQQIRAGLAQISPDLEASARIAGANRIRSSLAITIPLVSPWIIAVAVLTFGAAVRNISTVILLSSPRSQPLSLLLLQYSTSGQLEVSTAIGTVITALTVTFAWVMHRFSKSRLSA